MAFKTPAVWMRGGTSKGLFFHAADLPADPAERERLLLRVMGSPDPHGRQLDGMGGGISSLSKAAVIAPSSRPDVDVEYTFIQVSVDRAETDLSSTCGNLTAAVGPFAVEEGLVRAADGEATVRIFNTNSGQRIEARFPVSGGLPLEVGETVIAGVSFPGAAVELRFLDPAGSSTGQLLPAGAPMVEAGEASMSLVDASAFTAFVSAQAVGLTGHETPATIESRPDVLERLDQLRRAAAVRAGLGALPKDAPPATPRIAVVAPPADYTASDGTRIGALEYDIAVRMISMGRPHRAVPATGAMCLAAAAAIKGSWPAQLRRGGGRGPLRVGHPGGITEVAAEVSASAEGWRVGWTGLTRTARRLMEGAVLLPRG